MVRTGRRPLMRRRWVSIGCVALGLFSVAVAALLWFHIRKGHLCGPRANGGSASTPICFSCTPEARAICGCPRRKSL